MLISKIISGGQTGVDRAALDVAIEMNVAHGGWCPRGRLAEDGPLHSKYSLNETESKNYSIRTERNVRDSDGTLILKLGELEGGTRLTLNYAQQERKPYLIIDLASDIDTAAITRWLRSFRVSELNIAGPRESKHHGTYEKARFLIIEIITAAQLA